MNLNTILNAVFSTESTLTGAPQNSGAAPVSVVYRNGLAIVPAGPPVVANPAVGRYTLVYGLSAANGHVLNDYVTITEAVTLDGFAITRPVWEGNLVQAGCDVTPILNQTIYPLFTTHAPATGANADLDLGAAPVVTVYRNLVATAIVPVVLHPAVGVWIVTLPLTGATGWAAGDTVDILAQGTVSAIAAESFVFASGLIVGSAGGSTPHHEVAGHPLRSA